MLTREQASELAKETSIKVSDNLEKALDSAILEAIEQWKTKVDIALWYHDCKEDDSQVKAFLQKQWFEDVNVTHDYPWYNESYEWKTFIKFRF